MNTLIEETARFLSRSNSPFIREKSLTPDEIIDLMDKGKISNKKFFLKPNYKIVDSHNLIFYCSNLHYYPN